MVIGFTTTYAISGRLVAFSLGTPVSSTNKNWLPQYNWSIVESGIKHHNLNPQHEKSTEVLYLKYDVNLAYFTVPSMIPLPNEIPLPSSQDNLPHGILKKTSGFR